MCFKHGLTILSLLYLTSFVDSNDVLIGHASPYSRKIYSAVKIADPALWRRTDDFMINAPYHDFINAVYITDLRPDKEGEAYIEAGGIGSKTVTIALKSPSALRGYKFAIEVYAQSFHPYYHHTGYMASYYNNPPLSGVGMGGVGLSGVGVGGVGLSGVGQYPSYPVNGVGQYPSYPVNGVGQYPSYPVSSGYQSNYASGYPHRYYK